MVCMKIQIQGDCTELANLIDAYADDIFDLDFFECK